MNLMSFHTLFAYIDPATGSILLQVLAMAMVGIIAFFRQIKDFFLGIFGVRKNVTDSLDDEDEEDDEDDENVLSAKNDAAGNA